MSCKATVEGRQTEFEFFQQLMNSTDGQDCCGAVNHIVFDRASISAMIVYFAVMNLPQNYLDTFDPVMLDSRNLRLTMCARHWLQHSDLLHKGSHNFNRQDWNDISFYIHRTTCLLSGWDIKELSNYLR